MKGIYILLDIFALVVMDSKVETGSPALFIYILLFSVIECQTWQKISGRLQTRTKMER